MLVKLAGENLKYLKNLALEHPTKIAIPTLIGAAVGARKNRVDAKGKTHKRSTKSRVIGGIAGGAIGGAMGFTKAHFIHQADKAFDDFARQCGRNFGRDFGNYNRYTPPPRPQRFEGVNMFSGKFKTKAEAQAAYKTYARKYHPDMNPDNVKEATGKFQDMQKHWENFKDSYEFTKLAEFLNKKAMDLSITTPMAENAAIDSAASAMNTNSLAKRFRQPGKFVMPKFGGSNVINPPVATFKQVGA